VYQNRPKGTCKGISKPKKRARPPERPFRKLFDDKYLRQVEDMRFELTTS
jgi:hypothetical protein